MVGSQISYSDKKAYGQSKLANILHANELSRQLKVNISVLCFSNWEIHKESSMIGIHGNVEFLRIVLHDKFCAENTNATGRLILVQYEKGER